MKLGFILNEGETLSNFCLADAIYTECCLNKDYIDAETVANMLLLQVRRDNKDSEYEKRNSN